MDFEPVCISCCDIGQTCEFVLSCGDFLCGACEQKMKFGGNKCPECNKQVAKLCISNGRSELPEDVAKNLRDISDAMESLYDIIKFQLVHYKKIMKISCQRYTREVDSSYNERMKSAAIISDLEKRIDAYESSNRMGSGQSRDRERPATTSAYFTSDATGQGHSGELNFKRSREFATDVSEGSRYSSRQSGDFSGSTTAASSLSSSPIPVQPIQYFNNNQSVRDASAGRPPQQHQERQQERPQSSYSNRSANVASSAYNPPPTGRGGTFTEGRLSPQQMASLNEHKSASGISRSSGSMPARPSTTGASPPPANDSRLRSPYQALINRPGSIVSSSQTQQQYMLAQRLQSPLGGPAAYPAWTAPSRSNP